MKNYLSFDIGGTFIKYGIIGENAEILENDKVITPKTLEELLNTLDLISKQHPNTEGIAVSAPGAVSDEGIIKGSSAIPFIHGPNIKKLLAVRTGKAVYLENDANCAGYAEVWNGSAKGKQNVLVMVIGTGIGGAVIKDGTIHKGDNLHGGEFGYMLLTTDLESSDDVWSRIASTKALVKYVAKQKHVDFESLSGENIFELAEAGDQICMDALDRFYHFLAVGIYNLQYIYDPEVILIGGGISARDDLIDRINEKLDKIMTIIDLAKIKPNIDTCKFRQNANLLGAVYGYMKEYS
ncbi:ROK family protein [Aquibacillus halophilus]|uniref:ROK family protein n=1 Tax=Aquibacillus halophilus TaxID=930132 RepID=A0A6A8DED0_9BACI|nr:ROK family protein [Aquibacillus halophilus]MRH43924.1 ROK family protein [Aquibacillus halophilus]